MRNRGFIHHKGFLRFNGRLWPSLVTLGLFVLLVIISIVRFIYYRADTDELMAREVVSLALIFEQIDKECKIIDFDAQRVPINFLNVVKFVGSEVGAMNLVHPENWKGPYLTNNPTIQEKEYQLVTTNQGYFVTPGDGVVLSNDKVVGKDIVLDKQVNIKALMSDPESLAPRGRPLAARVRIQKKRYL